MSQAKAISVELPHGVDLRFRAMKGREALSQLFEYQVELAGHSKSVAKKDLLGKSMAVLIPLPRGGERRVHGHVRRFERVGQGGDQMYRYRVTLCPWLWFLTRSSDCRVFQSKSVPEIVDAVFEGYAAIRKVDKHLTGTYARRDYCVQYRETDFDFVSRLLEDEGITYYFRHEKEKHTLVLTDGTSGYRRRTRDQALSYLPQGHGGDTGREYLSEIDYAASVQPGAMTLRDFDFEKPSEIPSGQHEGADAGHDLKGRKRFDYPGGFLTDEAGKARAKIRQEELDAQHEWLRLGTATRSVMVGDLVSVANGPDFLPREDLLVTLTETRVGSFANESARESARNFMCRFLALPSTVPFRPPRSTGRPIVEGPQTAIVTGPSGKEIHTDKYGRVKVQFHWDRVGRKDEHSSCWVRVAHPWAGKNWGFMALPRIGQEVVVDFLEGDPDRPLITGSVYNGDQMPPWTLPDHDVFSGIRTHTVQGAAADFNELRFSDKQNEEIIYVHAQKDYEARIRNDRKHYVAHDSHDRVDGERRDYVKGKFHTLVEQDRVASISGSDQTKVTGEHTLNADASVSVKAGANWNVKAGANAAIAAGAEMHLKATTIVIEAAAMLTIKCGASSISFGPQGITIDGTPLVQVNCGGAPGAGLGSNPSSAPAAASALEAARPVN